jgi:hypothetical protein
METVRLNDGILHTIEYRETKIGDRVYDKNSNITYIATIEDADNLNWIVDEDTPTFKASEVTQIMSAYENVQLKIGDDWYYMSYDDLAKIVKKSRAKIKAVKKRSRTWAEPI